MQPPVKSVTGRLTASVKVSRSECSPSMSGIHGFMKMDLVAHCGRHISGTFLWTPSLTDIASGWTECVALLARNAELIIRTVDKVQKSLPFQLLGLDVDNGVEFINEALFEYCSARCIALTRSRSYRKNAQAWIKQKNGSVVRSWRDTTVLTVNRRQKQ